jgi:hypothetical protein
MAADRKTPANHLRNLFAFRAELVRRRNLQLQEKRERNRMQRKFVNLALAVATAVFAAGSAGAAVVRTKDILSGCGSSSGCVVGTDTTFLGTNEYVLDGPVFVVSGATLTIESGALVRGQPRYDGAVEGEARGTAGSIVVTRAGKIDAEGLPTQAGVIIFTSAVVDNNGDNNGDDLDSNGYPDQYPGFTAACVNGGGATAPEGPDNLLGTGDDELGTCVIDATPSFLDDAPRTAPLAPLNAAGDQNNGIWGGLILLGNAPTNSGLGCGGCTIGEDTAEGIPFPGYPEQYGTYGGAIPHDNSGTVKYVSIRHGGDEFNTADEVNGLTMGGVGDGTTIEFVEVYANYDDGFEWFGGTVNTNNLVVSYIGDDSFDTDQGFTGVNQFSFSISTFFQERDGGTYGTVSGDKWMELDGDDCAGNCNDAGPDSYSSTGNVGVAAWPPSNPIFYNSTHMGNALTVLHRSGTLISGSAIDYVPNAVCTADDVPYTCCSGLGAGTCTAPNNAGIDMKAGFMGEVRNSYGVNTAPGLGVLVGTGGAAGWNVKDNLCADVDGDAPSPTTWTTGYGDLVRVVSVTLDDVGTVSAAGDCQTTNGGTDRNAFDNGDTITTGQTSIVNDIRLSTGGGVTVNGFVNEDITFDPTGVAGTNKLGASLKTNGKIDPKRFSAAGFTQGTSPAAHPVPSPAVTFRGAFPSSGNLWTKDWTALHAGGLLVD